MSKLLGVIGDPIAHSLSPLIHNGWLRDLGYNGQYEAIQIPEGDLPRALNSLYKKGYSGFNVTLPHKTAALEVATEISDSARAIGAANTLSVKSDGTWRADNTDAPGFLEALGPVDSQNDRALLLGAGGSARAIVYALSAYGINLRVLNRTPSKAEELAETLGRGTALSGALNQYKEYIDSATIVINTTSMGHQGVALDLPNGDGRRFFDISYGKVSEPQLNLARDRGWSVQDGLSMLVAQAALSFEIWFGEKPDMESALKRCQEAIGDAR